jgi:glutaredoxin
MVDTDITLYGTLWCSDCKRTKQFFGEPKHREMMEESVPA